MVFWLTWGEILTAICIYGEIGFDWLVETEKSINYRWGGAGLYAAIAAAKQGVEVDLLTVLGDEVSPYSRAGWEALGISFCCAKYEDAYSLPKYLITGFGQYMHKVSRPMTEVRLNIDYSPDLPRDCNALLIFPLNHSLPENLCHKAIEHRVPIFLDPKPNEASINEARRLLPHVDVLLVNEEEATMLSGFRDGESAAKTLIGQGVKKVVIKRGVRGCLVVEGAILKNVPAFKSEAICTLGSGDVFAGALVASYMQNGNLLESVEIASCVAAHFIERIAPEGALTKLAAEHEMKKRPKIHVPDTDNKYIYLAGPFFCEQERIWVDRVCVALESAGLQIYSPSRENGIITLSSTEAERERTFISDLELIEQSKVVVALLDHEDSGTHFEIGYAHKKGIPVIGLQTSGDQPNNMILFGCQKIVRSLSELIEELYERLR